MYTSKSECTTILLLTSGQSAANGGAEMGYNFNKSQQPLKRGKKDGLESNNYTEEL